ncbi:hypothetical protein [Methylobacterium sp. NEAU K]|uniref:hypothetical protein n=1 Tax=Methylobacterium sp. NEAU K TaxID=3064946 RepID=UPI0027326CCB|nr:hypothetical protein [Methylobacterium sp. NEAU K]MDP4003100.1 hypothetical protein [Methylobacterium sp. NEAU K]
MFRTAFCTAAVLLSVGPAAAAPKKADSVDLRGDTDESSDRGIRFLVENNMGAGK